MTTEDKAVPKVVGGGVLHTTPEGWYHVSEAAQLVGKSVDTLRRWRRKGVFVPSGVMVAGELRCYVYSDEDIERLKEIALSIRPGRKASA